MCRFAIIPWALTHVIPSQMLVTIWMVLFHFRMTWCPTTIWIRQTTAHFSTSWQSISDEFRSREVCSVSRCGSYRSFSLHGRVLSTQSWYCHLLPLNLFTMFFFFSTFHIFPSFLFPLIPSVSGWTLNILSCAVQIEFANHCILFSFTFYAEYQLFGNQGCKEKRGLDLNYSPK